MAKRIELVPVDNGDLKLYMLLRATMRLIDAEVRKAPYDPYKACREIHALTQRAIEAMDEQKGANR